jgi:hypothetical protein
VFWWFFGPELSHNISLTIKRIINVTIPEEAKVSIPDKDYSVLEKNFNLIRIHFMIVVIALPLIYAILFYNNGKYLKEVRILSFIYAVFIPINILYSKILAPRIILNSDREYNRIIYEEKENILK